MEKHENPDVLQDEMPPTPQAIDKLVPLQCITFADEKATFNAQDVHSLVEGVLDEEVYVISIAGLARSGKSFFLNLLMNYLDYFNEDDKDTDWETDCKTPISGFNWATGKKKSVTKGIWMFLYPRPVLGRRLLLLDCQGTRDQEQSTAKLDSMVLFYGLTLSSLQIMNVQRDIEPSDLDTLAACMLSNEQKGKEQAYEQLRFLIRDWQDDEEDPEQLQDLVVSTQAETVRKSGQTILLAFEGVKVVALPGPGMKVARASLKDNLVVQSADEDFLQEIKKMFKEMCELIGKGPRQKLTGRDFANKFTSLGQRTVGSFKSPAEIRMAVLVGEAFDDAGESFLVEMKKELRKMKLNGELNLHSIRDTVIEGCIQRFLSDERVASYATDDQLSENLALLYLVEVEAVGSLQFLIEMTQWEERDKIMTKKLAQARENSRQLRAKWEKYLEKNSSKKLEQTEKNLRESEKNEADTKQEIEKGERERLSLLEIRRKRGSEFPPFSQSWMVQKKMLYAMNKMYNEFGLASLVVI